jgi:hypothetical protein
MLLAHKSKVIDFWDEEELVRTYYQEIQEISLALTECDRACVTAHTLRLQGDPVGDRLSETKPRARDAAFIVHNDVADTVKEQYLNMEKEGIKTILFSPVEEGGLGIPNSEVFLRGRLAIINFWRPMCSKPLRRSPLAVLDATTIGDSDIVVCRRPMQQENESFLKFYKLPLPFINTLARPNPNHKWYYPPNMTRDELFIFKNFDSICPAPKNGVGMHSSFSDPNTTPDAPPRESVETRVVCFWYSEEDREHIK